MSLGRGNEPSVPDSLQPTSGVRVCSASPSASSLGAHTLFALRSTEIGCLPAVPSPLTLSHSEAAYVMAQKGVVVSKKASTGSVLIGRVVSYPGGQGSTPLTMQRWVLEKRGREREYSRWQGRLYWAQTLCQRFRHYCRLRLRTICATTLRRVYSRYFYSGTSRERAQREKSTVDIAWRLDPPVWQERARRPPRDMIPGFTARHGWAAASKEGAGRSRDRRASCCPTPPGQLLCPAAAIARIGRVCRTWPDCCRSCSCFRCWHRSKRIPHSQVLLVGERLQVQARK